MLRLIPTCGFAEIRCVGMTRGQKCIDERAADAEAGDRTDRGKRLARKAHDGRRIAAQPECLPIMDGARSGNWRRFRFLPGIRPGCGILRQAGRSEEHTSELQSLMRSSYAV